jgi:methylase of polypeptide subunit release factors
MTVRRTVVGGLMIAHDERVLTPRPWTHEQADWARDLLATLPEGRVLELCSGAGHIGLLTLLGNDRTLVMVDASLAACDFARANAASAGMSDRVEVRHGRLESEVEPDEVFPLVLADPPWVPSEETVRFPEDPVHAIDGGPDGLDVARTCMTVIGTHLHDDGVAVLQVGSPEHAEAVTSWLEGRPGLRLESAGTRTFESRGTLVLLRRPGRDVP